MTAKILQLFPFASYEAALNEFEKHLKDCTEGCGQDRLCDDGQRYALLAWAHLNPIPRPSARRPAGRRRSG